VAGVADLQLGELVDTAVDQRREPPQQPRLLARRDVAPGGECLGGALDRGVAPGAMADLAATDCSVAGLTTVWVLDIWSYILSKPRRSSQSVTAASNAVSSTSAMLV
jgi:hypothetical protein